MQSTLTGTIRNYKPYIISETQTTVTKDDEIASVREFSQEFEDDFESDIT